ncbi:GxxExxY protein [Breznakibacter xylanolyticus]|uniref:GxxExxY protein n=1 Tax=Breznakibacter xylanolyticus TaxID=990 RepID=UPI003744917E
MKSRAVNLLESVHDAQVQNYLKATDYKLGLLVNLGEQSLKYKRIVLESTNYTNSLPGKATASINTKHPFPHLESFVQLVNKINTNDIHPKNCRYRPRLRRLAPRPPLLNQI